MVRLSEEYEWRCKRCWFAVEASLPQPWSSSEALAPLSAIFAPLVRGARSRNRFPAGARSPKPSAVLARGGSRTPNAIFQGRHLYRRQRRLQSLVPHLQPGPINRLLQPVASQNAKGMGHTSLLRRLPNPTRDLVDDHVIMRRIPAQQAANTDQSVVFPSQSQGPCRRRNLKRAWNPHDVDVFLRRPGSNQAIRGAHQ